jgi:hypothetical protein
MYFNWGNYTIPLHLNNTTGFPVINGNYANATTTPFVVLSEANGNSYMPNSTMFMDVYSGGSPYTLTQELVQRGAEIQEDTLRIAVSASTFELAAQLVDTLRHALTEQEATGPQILKIKRQNQTTYTEWLIMGAKIQEDQSYFARDAIDTAYPTIYLAIKLARSPYGSEGKPYITANVDLRGVYNTNLFDLGNILIPNYPMLYNSFINLDFQYDFLNATVGVGPATFGPLVFSLVDDDTYYTDTTTTTSVLAAGAAATLSTHTYTIRNVSDLTAPVCISAVLTNDSNYIEMRATINGYSTPYVRSIGTHINATSPTSRLYILPTIDVAKIFAGVPDYDMTTSIPISLQIRNINRTTVCNYTSEGVNIWRSNNVMQLYPTSNWSARTDNFVYYRVFSFYDQLEFPAQPLPNVKSIITTSEKTRLLDINTLNNISMSFEEASEIRGTQIRVTQKSGNLRMVVFACAYDGSLSFPAYPAGDSALNWIRVSFAPIYQNIKGVV